jgi:hypothetical protein
MEQIELIRHAVEVLDRLAVPYALVGSWGSGIYGEPRFTRDIDIVLDLNLAQLPRFCAAFPDDEFYFTRVSAYLAADFGEGRWSRHPSGPRNSVTASSRHKC